MRETSVARADFEDAKRGSSVMRGARAEVICERPNVLASEHLVLGPRRPRRWKSADDIALPAPATVALAGHASLFVNSRYACRRRFGAVAVVVAAGKQTEFGLERSARRETIFVCVMRNPSRPDGPARWR